MHFPEWKYIYISINIPLKFVPKSPINGIPAWVQIVVWRRPGDKPLSEPMMVSLLTRVCVARPQWVINVLAGDSHMPLSRFFLVISSLEWKYLTKFHVIVYRHKLTHIHITLFFFIFCMSRENHASDYTTNLIPSHLMCCVKVCLFGKSSKVLDLRMALMASCWVISVSVFNLRISLDCKTNMTQLCYLAKTPFRILYKHQVTVDAISLWLMIPR